MNRDVYTRKIWWKTTLIVFGTFIGLASLLYTETFLQELRAEEERKIALWAEAIEAVFYLDDETDLSFYSKIIQDNNTIPVLLTDSAGVIIAHRNLNVPEKGAEEYLERKLEEFKESGSVLENSFGEGNTNYLYYKGSHLLTKLRWYPLILLSVIGIYMLIGYMAFSNARRSEQNKVWTGMAKETAHQIGTPLSALMGWTTYLRDKYPGESAFDEMDADIARLTTITERFSKIGSQPELTETDLSATIAQTFAYLRPRLGNKIELKTTLNDQLIVRHNAPLLSWVLENMIKNATDALQGEGEIRVDADIESTEIKITIADDGRGMSLSEQRKIFNPGYTTKKRGWGLGLSLAKRIIEEYHGGKLVLIQSQPGIGTTFAITIPFA